MGTIPVASPSPMRKPRFRRELAILFTLVAIAGTLTAVAIFAWPTDSKVDQAGGGWVTVGDVNDFQLLEPVLNQQTRAWLIRINDEEILALSRRDPRGCSLPWNPEASEGGSVIPATIRHTTLRARSPLVPRPVGWTATRYASRTVRCLSTQR